MKKQKIIDIINNHSPELAAEEILLLFGINNSKCTFCGSENIEPSMFIDEWDCNNCLKNFKEKDFS